MQSSVPYYKKSENDMHTYNFLCSLGDNEVFKILKKLL